MSIPILPSYQRDLLERGQHGNASLFFSRMTQWWWSKEKNRPEPKYEIRKDKNNKSILDSSIVLLGKQINTRLQSESAGVVLKKIHDRQAAILGDAAADGSMALEIRAKLTSPYVSGLGSGHPTETGLILDRNSGVPYIPASSVKGVLRLACALRIAETEPERIEPEGDQWKISDTHPLLRRYFGDTDTVRADGVRGQLVFLDAFPAEVSDSLLKDDIMNPHFGEYYSGGKNGPLETEAPKPVKFLAVNEEKTEFVFRCFALPLPDNAVADLKRPFDKTDEDNIKAMFRKAFTEVGFGAKTAIGYGRFDAEHAEIRDTASLKERAVKEAERKRREAEEEAERKRRGAEEEAERKRREAEEKAEQERLAKEAEQFPWKPWLRDVSAIEEWDPLEKLVLNNADAPRWLKEEGAIQAVKDAMQRVRKKFPVAWKKKGRSAICDEWLAKHT